MRKRAIMNKKWHNALTVVKQKCEKIEDCGLCPLYYNEERECMLTTSLPCEWQLVAAASEPGKEQGCDNVNHPEHYTQGKVECIDALAAATINLQGIEAVCTANAIKYLWRWKQKNGVEDLKKAKWYIDKLMQEEGGCNHE